MPFPTTCPGCSSVYQVGDAVEGRQLLCRKCQKTYVATRGAAEAIAAKPGVAALPPRARRGVSWLLVGLAAGLLGVVALVGLSVAGGAIYWYTSRGSKTPVAVVGTAPRPMTSEPAKKEEPKPNPVPGAPKGQLSPQALKDLKGATVFLKVDGGGDLKGSGSGFLVKIAGDTGYVITNHHVVNPEAEMLAPIRRGRTTIGVRVVKVHAKNVLITAVFHSGSKDEKAVRAEVLATDSSRDLAVLRVQGMTDWPKPIDLDQKVQLVETMPVYIMGFPFGQALSLTNGAPAVTINKGSVSSLRQNEFGEMKAVQIDGAINPGNSGGPVVDEEGRLIGVSVATIRGSGIGLAIAPDELARMFEGRVGGVTLTRKNADPDAAEFDVEMQLIDPMSRLASVALLYRTGPAAPRTKAHADGQHDALAPAQRVELKIAGQVASGTLKVNRTGAAARMLIFQTAYVNGSGRTIYTQPGAQGLGAGPVAVQPPPPPNNVKLPESPPISGDFNVTHLKMNGALIPRCLVWDADGKSFFCLEQSGVLRKIALDGFKETLKCELGTPCAWMAQSAEGLVISAPTAQEVWLIDPEKLTTKLKIKTPNVGTVASAPSLSLAYTHHSRPFSGQEPMCVIDLKKGEIVQRYKSNELTTKVIGFHHHTVTPDGKYLLTRAGFGVDMIHRFKIDGTTLTYEDSSKGVGRNTQALEVSPDSQWVSLPSGGGNAGAPAYSTLIFSVTDLSSPVATISSGAYPRAMGFDPKVGYVYAQNHDKQLIVYSMKGAKLKELSIPGAGEVKQILPQPDGGSVVILTGAGLYHAVLKP